VREHLPSLSAAGVEIDPSALSSVGWTVAQFDDAVTLKQLGYADGNDCEQQ
jgi:predicted alpha/beta-fold hydrolase